MPKTFVPILTQRRSPSLETSSTVRQSGSPRTPSPSVSETPCLAMLSASLFGSNSTPMPEYMHDVHIRQTSRRALGWRLTVKLRGRTTTSDKRRGRTLSLSARGANQTTPHGPLQRLLGGNLLERELWSASANRGVF